MKSILSFILIVGFGYLASFFLPWWLIAIICFIIGFFVNSSGLSALLVGFLSVFVLWGVLAYIASYNNDFIMLNRMTQLFNAPSKYVLLASTALLGGFIGMLSTLSGYFLKTFNVNKKKKNNYYT